MTRLQRLEAESIFIIREVAATADNPVLLYSIGKDSGVLLRLALKAFYPAPLPFPLLHVDTMWKFRAMTEFRDRLTKDLGCGLIVHVNEDGLRAGVNPFTSGSRLHTDVMKTQGLKQALDKYKFDAAFGGARRDEEKSRAKERVFSLRSAEHRWDPKNQRPEPWHLYNTRKAPGESFRVFPLSNWTEADVWERITGDFRQAAASLGFTAIVPIPICAREGDNIASRSKRTPWYEGPVLLDHLETVRIAPAMDCAKNFRFPVQLVNRPNQDFRGYAGTVASGVMHVNQPVVALPGGQRSRIARIIAADGDRASAAPDEAVTVTLSSEIDVCRGDVIVPADDPLRPLTAVASRLLWMAEEELNLGQNFVVRLGTASANARVARIHYAIDMQTFAAYPATTPGATLGMNDIGLVDLAFDKPLIAADYATDRTLGALILVDRMTNQTVAMGVVEPAPTHVGGVAERSDPGVRLFGPDGPKGSALFWRGAANRMLGGAALSAIVTGLSGNWWLAILVGLAEILLCPVLERLTAFARNPQPVSPAMVIAPGAR
jgi:sulfate adenylyltransferase subunit 2